MIYFGTGSLLSTTDPADTTVQALYGIYDNLLHNLNSTPYVAETALVSFPITMAAGADKRTIGTAAAPVWYNVTGGTSTNPAKKGWIVPLSGTNVVAGERVIAPPVRFTLPGTIDAFIFTSVVPSTDDCIAGLDTWITGIDAMSGGYAKVFDAITEDSVRVQGGSPRGVFVLTDATSPTLYISQTIFDNTVPPPSTTFATGTGGQQTVCINNQCGDTRIISIGLKKPPTVTPATTLLKSPTQVWRQLK